MATADGNESFQENLPKTDGSNPTETPFENLELEDENIKSWGFNLNELYSLSTTFLKEKEGKAFHLSYKDKLSIVAFSQQVAHGKFIPEKAPPLGYLDVIGRDRRQAWIALGDMSVCDAKSGLINLLNDVCPLFRPFVQAQKAHLEECERLRKKEEELKRIEEEELERWRLEEEALEREEEQKIKEEKERQKDIQQKRLIQEALNRQTFQQFKSYAEKQFPYDPEQQAVLIRQLQEQHYQQYMQQVLQEQLSEPMVQNHNSETDGGYVQNQNHVQQSPAVQNHVQAQYEVQEPCSVRCNEICDPLPLPAAHMWTRKEIADFKETIRKEGSDGVLKVGHGETVTIRVPTHDDGAHVYWEFATDSFDLGFGVYFEWSNSPETQITVHVSDSEDDAEEDDDEEFSELEQARLDLESGSSPVPDKPAMSVIIPIYRRDCHEEVYIGSHSYPGQGVYLLKFDNSYSLWRSKTLYYRVYYTR